MSLHRYVLPPPLALSISPAPPHKPKPSAAADKDKDKEAPKKEAGVKAPHIGDAKGPKATDDDDKAKNEQPPKNTEQGAGKAASAAAEPNVAPALIVNLPPQAPAPAPPAAEGEGAGADQEPITPATPGSMTPEPPTPAPGAEADAQAQAEEEAAVKEAGHGAEKEKGGQRKDQNQNQALAIGLAAAEVPAPAPNKARFESSKLQVQAAVEETPVNATGGEAKKSEDTKKSTSIKDITPEPEPESDQAPAPAPAPGPEPEPEPEPLRLLRPAPPRPLRTRLELNPSKPYPPIYTDPRGAYHKYARAVGQEWILIDVTKDGWLAEQWKERTEREALKRLTGEWEKELEIEMERQRKRAEIRQVPQQAEKILLQLWNELVEANNHEIHADEFWSRYDWTTDSARKHLSDYRRKSIQGGSESEPKAKNDSDGDGDAENNAEREKSETTGDAEEEVEVEVEVEVEWTKAGLEEILGTVGIQCAYNTPKPLGKSYADPREPPAGYLLMSHAYFLLRNDLDIRWKAESNADKFEVLVTSGHDRVFGAMVKAQREKEYRERKMKERAAEKEKEKEKEKAREAAAEGGKDKDKDDTDKDKIKEDEVKDDVRDKHGKTAEDKLKVQTPVPGGPGADEEPGTPVSNIKLHDGQPVAEGKDGGAEPELELGKKDVEAKANTKAAVAIVDLKEDVAMIAVPVDGEKKSKAEAGDQAEDKDKKHEQEAVIVPGPKAIKDKKEDENKKEDVVADQANKDGPAAAAAEKPMNMGRIAQAFQALEAAKNPKPVDPNAKTATGTGEKDKVPLVWTWSERCETWRWKNYEAGLHDVGPGGWEERDWKVFADDREVWDFDANEAVIEVEEEDIHDWSF
ncbi:hypothetical protein IAT40_006849 [Kwoniella sp. CBS 6097]